LLDLDGHELARLDGWMPYLDGRVMSPSGTAFSVDAPTHALVPAAPVASDLPDIDLPPPPGTTVDAGHWANAFGEPDGDRTIATWSGECEVPSAFVVQADRSMRPVRGNDLRDAPESYAFGWAPDGRAVVSFFEGVCGNGIEPGVHLIDLDDADATPFRVTPYSYGFLWTPTT
jgi:hypothetical protein